MSSTRHAANSARVSNRYPEEIRRQAVELFNSSLSEYKTRQATARRVVGLFGVKCSGTVPTWARQAETDSGSRAGIATEAAEGLRRLRREDAELRWANAILRAASVFFAAEPGRS
jgi:transposase